MRKTASRSVLAKPREKRTVKDGAARGAPMWLSQDARAIWYLWGESYRRKGLEVTECPVLFGQLCGIMAGLLEFFGRPISDVTTLCNLSELEPREKTRDSNQFGNNGRNL